ncbi:hypothetical protein BC829DRAFT_443122 [Chytridium lagenaria]|nr:hypothetical protein BC829DRAFT_443122 [Chytridium lagenaria]
MAFTVEGFRKGGSTMGKMVGLVVVMALVLAASPSTMAQDITYQYVGCYRSTFGSSRVQSARECALSCGSSSINIGLSRSRNNIVYCRCNSPTSLQASPENCPSCFGSFFCGNFLDYPHVAVYNVIRAIPSPSPLPPAPGSSPAPIPSPSPVPPEDTFTFPPEEPTDVPPVLSTSITVVGSDGLPTVTNAPHTVTSAPLDSAAPSGSSMAPSESMRTEIQTISGVPFSVLFPNNGPAITLPIRPTPSSTAAGASPGDSSTQNTASGPAALPAGAIAGIIIGIALLAFGVVGIFYQRRAMENRRIKGAATFGGDADAAGLVGNAAGAAGGAAVAAAAASNAKNEAKTEASYAPPVNYGAAPVMAAVSPAPAVVAPQDAVSAAYAAQWSAQLAVASQQAVAMNNDAQWAAAQQSGAASDAYAAQYAAQQGAYYNAGYGAAGAVAAYPTTSEAAAYPTAPEAAASFESQTPVARAITYSNGAMYDDNDHRPPSPVLDGDGAVLPLPQK